MGLSPSEVTAVEEWLLFRATRDQLSTGDATQLAIDMADDDVTQEVNAGAARLRDFFESVNSRLDGIDWGQE